MNELLILGAGGHARVVADVVDLMGRHIIVGFLDEVQSERWGGTFCHRPILGGLEQLPLAAQRGVRDAFVAVGDCAARLRLASAAQEAGFEFPVLRHPHSVAAAAATFGPGTVLAAGAIVNPGARLGAHVIVNTAASVDHDCQIEDGVHVCPGARLAGDVFVGRASWIGLGAVIKERVHIGAGSTIGAGAVVLHDIPPGVVAFGSPARVVREAGSIRHAGR